MNMNRYIKVLCFATLFAAACFTALAVRAETTYNGANPDDVATWNTATATKLTVEENDSVAITNGEFELVAGVPSFGEGSTFKILDGAKLFATNSARQFALTADNSRILMDGGYLAMSLGSVSGSSHKGLFVDTASNCRWDLSNGSTISVSGYYGWPQMSGSNNVISVVNSTNYFPTSSHVARSMKFYKAEDCVWSLTNAYLSSFSIAFGNPGDQSSSSYQTASYNGYARRNRLIFHDSIATLANKLGLSLGSQKEGFTNESFSNRVEVTGTSGSVTLKCIKMRGFADVFRMEGGTLSIESSQSYMNGTNNRFENAGGTVKIHDDGLALLEVGRGNVFSNCGGTWSKQIVVNGVSNSVELTSGTISGAVTLEGGTNLYTQTGGTADGATTVGGTTNRLEMAGGTRTGDVTLNGTNGVFRLSGGLFTAALTMNGVSNIYEHVSGVSTGDVTVAGFGNTLYFKGGTHWGQYRAALRFTENTTNNTVVIDDAEFIHHGTFGKSYSSGNGYPYTNSPNCAIEFRGAAPKFRVTSSKQAANSTPNHTVNLGRGTEPMQDPVRLRFVLPETPYEEAPFRSEVYSHWVVLDGNAVIEVDDSNLPKSHGKLRYPLIYDDYNFHANSTLSINVESLNAVNRALGTIGENMTLVRDGKTLYVEIKSSGGFVLVVR